MVFNTIDDIPQKDYIVAIDQIVQPKNILFVSRISNNKFLLNKGTLEIKWIEN